MYDISNNITHSTWFGSNNKSSRIDIIFSSSNFVSDFLYCGLQTPSLYNTDHKIVIAYFSDLHFTKEAMNRKWQNKKLIPIFAKMDIPSWDKFSHQTQKYYNENKLDVLLAFSPTITHINHI